MLSMQFSFGSIHHRQRFYRYKNIFQEIRYENIPWNKKLQEALESSIIVFQIGIYNNLDIWKLKVWLLYMTQFRFYYIGIFYWVAWLTSIKVDLFWERLCASIILTIVRLQTLLTYALET